MGLAFSFKQVSTRVIVALAACSKIVFGARPFLGLGTGKKEKSYSQFILWIFFLAPLPVDFGSTLRGEGALASSVARLSKKSRSSWSSSSPTEMKGWEFVLCEWLVFLEQKSDKSDSLFCFGHKKGKKGEQKEFEVFFFNATLKKSKSLLKRANHSFALRFFAL